MILRGRERMAAARMANYALAVLLFGICNPERLSVYLQCTIYGL